MKLSTELSTHIRATMELRNISNRDLGRRTGIDHTHLSRVFAGKRGLSGVQLKAVARALKVKLDYRHKSVVVEATVPSPAADCPSVPCIPDSTP